MFIQGPLPYASLSSRGKEVREKGQRIIIPHYILFYSNTSFIYFGLVKQSVLKTDFGHFSDTKKLFVRIISNVILFVFIQGPLPYASQAVVGRKSERSDSEL